MDTSDEHLARAAAGGDRGAFSTLLDRHYDRIFGLACRLTGARAEAEDLTQDICAALPAKLGGFRGDALFTTWLYRVTVNAAHDHRRRAASQMKARDGWGAWELERRASAAEMQKANDWLQSAMMALTPELRETVALILGEELTQKDAAAVLDVSEGTIAWRMSEVKKRLRALHEKEEQA